jgi:hypothetical protein
MLLMLCIILDGKLIPRPWGPLFGFVSGQVLALISKMFSASSTEEE